MSPRRAAFAALTLLCLAGVRPEALASEESGWMPEEEATASEVPGTVTCESRGDERKHCAVQNIVTGSVSMERQLSQTICQRGVNWGADRDGIWVDDGCRAVFAFVYRRVGSASTSSRPGTIRCESQGDRRNHCEVPNIDPGSVTLDRKLSQADCYRGQSWDVDTRGIWVDKGCRAEFSYASRSGGSAGSGGVSEASMRDACIRRAARDWSVTASELEITYAERLQNGAYRFNIQSRRSAGTCMVDPAGNVYRLDTR